MKPVVALVEPVLEDAERIAEYLAESGYYAAMAGNAARGLALVRSTSPGLVIINQGLPDLSGFRLAQQIARDPATAGIPIVMVGRTADPGTRAWAQRAGAVDYYSKESDDLPARLAEAVSRYLRPLAAEPIPRLDDALLQRIRRIIFEVQDDPYLNAAGKAAVVAAEVAAMSGLKHVAGAVVDLRGKVIDAEHEWLVATDGTIVDPSVQQLWPRIKGWPGYDDVAVIARAMPLHAQYQQKR